MRQRRLLIVLAIAGGLWAPRDAAARCELTGPYLGTGPQLPLGCPLHVYIVTLPGFVRQVTVLRGGAYVDVTGTATPEHVELLVERTFVDCFQQAGTPQKTLEPFDLWALQPAGVTVGERVGFGAGWVGGIEIVAAGPCAAPIPPMPACTEVAPECGRPPPFEDFGPGGCDARGGGGLLAGLALLGLIRRGPRRRRR
jgi:hypothetical protein